MFLFGVDYYPEQWPEERWPIDARLMSEAGMNIVRLAEFAWAKMEPSEGIFDFKWLDRAMDVLGKYGIKAILGTPTASAPAWLMQKSPDLFRVRENGTRVTYGNRRGYCSNQPLYHEYAQQMVTAMADHFANHPNVVGWQIDNEFGERCYCELCRKKFHEWLRSRYEDLEDLNHRWGTIFWSQAYSDWAEIPVPIETGGSPNPGLALDYGRFCSDSYVAFQSFQAEILRKKCPEHLLTHNLMGFGYDQLNYFDIVRDLDVVSLDEYPRSQFSERPCREAYNIALDLATMRGLKKQNFWVIEQQAGSGGWELISSTPRPGEMRLWAYQSIAHGADGILFFRWRSSRFGTEQYWHGLLDHDATPGRRYEEAKRMGAEIRRIGSQIAGSVVKSPVAIILSYDSRFAFEIQPNNPLFSYGGHFQEIYRAFRKLHISVDIVSPTSDLGSYQLVIAPALHVLPERCAEGLSQFVRNGGTLLVTQRSGVKDESNAIVNKRLPGLLEEVCGVEVEEYDSLNTQTANTLEYMLPELYGKKAPPVGVFCEILKPITAGILARYTQEFYAGQPAITMNSYGKGWAVYVGSVGGAQLFDDLAGWLAELAEVHPPQYGCAELEITERWQGEKRFLFALNHSDSRQLIHLDGTFMDLLSGNIHSGSSEIASKDLLILIPIDQ